MYDRLLRRNTPQIEWHADETLLLGPQSIKSARELEAYRTAGDLITRALTAACESLFTGRSSAEAAVGGSSHSDARRRWLSSYRYPSRCGYEHRVLSMDLYGYHTMPPAAGEVVRAWIMGPIFQGYWMDPGRSLICGNQPTAAATCIAGRCRRGGGRLGGGHAARCNAAAVGRSRQRDRPQARLLRPSAIEGTAAGPWPRHEFHTLYHSHRRRRGGSRRQRCVTMCRSRPAW